MAETPMQKQWNAMKKEAEGCILFFQVGDFYEMFENDAVEASEILEITLTSRDKGKDTPRMCGFPMKAAEKYIAKLTRHGKKVAIVEQTTPPGKTKIVERKIVRIVTPGTTFSDQVLESGKSNFIAGLYSCDENGKTAIAVAFTELSTGDCFVQNFPSLNDAVKEISIRNVAEVLISPEQYKEYSKHFNYFSGVLSRHFLPDNDEKFLKQFFGVKTLKAFTIERNPSAISATALLCSFLEETQKISLSHITGVSYKTHSHKLLLDIDTIKNLEIFASSAGDKNNGLLKHINHTKTAMGARALHERMIQPFARKEDICEEYNKNTFLIAHPHLLDDIRTSFKNIADIERIIARISTHRASISDYVLLQKSIEEIEICTQKIDAHIKNIENNKDDLDEKTGLLEWKEWNKYCKTLLG